MNINDHIKDLNYVTRLSQLLDEYYRGSETHKFVIINGNYELQEKRRMTAPKVSVKQIIIIFDKKLDTVNSNIDNTLKHYVDKKNVNQIKLLNTVITDINHKREKFIQLLVDKNHNKCLKFKKEMSITLIALGILSFAIIGLPFMLYVSKTRDIGIANFQKRETNLKALLCKKIKNETRHSINTIDLLIKEEKAKKIEEEKKLEEEKAKKLEEEKKLGEEKAKKLEDYNHYIDVNQNPSLAQDSIALSLIEQIDFIRQFLMMYEHTNELHGINTFEESNAFNDYSKQLQVLESELKAHVLSKIDHS